MSNQWPTATGAVASWRREPYIILVATTLALCSALLLFYATPHGIGASPDSATFVDTARQLRGGHSLLALSATHQPPLYPLILAITAVGGLDPLASARWLQILLFAANAALFTLLLGQVVQVPWLLAAGALLFLFSPPVLLVHTFAWSEALFILFLLCGLMLTASFLRNGSRPLLLLAALSIALACLTRYAGLPLIASGALGILLLARGPWRQRLFNATLFAIVSALPLTLWLARNFLVAGAATSRQLAFHPAGRAHFWQIFYTVSGWLQIPSSAPDILRGVIWLALLAAVVAIALANHQSSRPASESNASKLLFRLLVLFALVYVAFLLASISFFDANTPLDNRLLAPLFVALLPAALFLWQRALILPAFSARGRLFLFIPLVLLVVITAFQSISQLPEQRLTGLGYNGPAWQHSPLLAQIDKIPQNTAIFSNAPEAIILLQNREAQALPRKNDAMSQTANQTYQQELNALGAQMEAGAAVAVYFHALANRPVASETELRDQFALHAVAQTADGLILGVPQRAEP